VVRRLLLCIDEPLRRRLCCAIPGYRSNFRRLRRPEHSGKVGPAAVQFSLDNHCAALGRLTLGRPRRRVWLIYRRLMVLVTAVRHPGSTVVGRVVGIGELCHIRARSAI
jgi:hypothetical protein